MSIFAGFKQNVLSAAQDIDVMLIINDEMVKVVVSREDMYQRTWNHACWVYADDTNLFYSNGKLIATVLSPDTVQGSTPFPAAADMLDSAFIIGQDQGKLRGGFSVRKMFQGSVSELNIWNTKLKVNEISDMNRCETFSKGNIVAWEQSKLRPNIAGFEVVQDLKGFCDKKEYFVFPSEVLLLKASDHCLSMGGQVAAPSNEDENRNLLEIINQYPECLANENKIAWIGVEKKANNVTWNQVGISGSDSNAVFNNLDEDILKDLENEGEDICLTMRSDGSWNTYRDCKSVTNSIHACYICQFSRVPNLVAKGFCAEAPANWIYYLVQNGSEYFFEGYKRDRIVQTPEGWEWNLSDGRTLLKLKPYSVGPIGRNLWIKQDTMYRECGLGAPDDKDELNYTSITLSTCSLQEEFTCENGDCIDKYKRCDDSIDCDDNSDEYLCTVVQVDPDYRSGDPPKIKDKINFIKTTITIIRFDNIALDGTMELTLNIEMTWSDDKLTFLNIMDDDSFNTTSTKEVSTSKQSRLWLPLNKIVHKNAVIGEIIEGTNNFVRVIANTKAIDGDSTYSKEGGHIILSIFTIIIFIF